MDLHYNNYTESTRHQSNSETRQLRTTESSAKTEHAEIQVARSVNPGFNRIRVI